MTITVNGRFVNAQITGVQRYAYEVTKRLEGKIRIIRPQNKAQGLSGHFWEQIILPRRIKQDDLLWSPANTGPLRVHNQVVTIHDASVLDYPEWFNRVFAAWYRILLPRLARGVRRVITDSRFSKDRLREMTGVLEERIQVVPLGVSETFRPAPLEQVKEIRRRYALEDPYLLVVGSLEPRKNLARLFRAWELIYNKTTANVLAVAGVSGRNFRDAGFAAAPAGVQFLGYAAEDGLPALYSGASGLVFPSVYEGFGLPALEAMACGTPVIASRAASLPEVVGDAGLLFDPFDVEEMSEAIATLLEDTGLRDELRQRGLARARQFSWEATTQMTWEVLCQACEDED